MTESNTDPRLRLTTDIVASYLANNRADQSQLPDIIRQVFATLTSVDQPEAAAAPPQEPAVPVRRSVFPDHIICLEDGKKLKMLKRHLMTDHKMTPEQYRAKWGLPRDYPMVAPDYAAVRSSLAKSSGLGHIRSDRPAAQQPVKLAGFAKPVGRPPSKAPAVTLVPPSIKAPPTPPTPSEDMEEEAQVHLDREHADDFVEVTAETPLADTETEIEAGAEGDVAQEGSEEGEGETKSEPEEEEVVVRKFSRRPASPPPVSAKAAAKKATSTKWVGAAGVKKKTTR